MKVKLMVWVATVLVDTITVRDQCFETPVDAAVMFSQNNLISFHNQNMLLTGSGEVECKTFGPIHTRQGLVYLQPNVIASILQVWMEILTSTKFCLPSFDFKSTVVLPQRRLNFVKGQNWI